MYSDTDAATVEAVIRASAGAAAASAFNTTCSVAALEAAAPATLAKGLAALTATK